MPDLRGVELVPIDASNWRAATAIRLEPDQLRFVADHEPVALVILAKAAVGEGGATWRPLAVVSEETIVGVLALAEHDLDGWLFHLVIDRARQGEGFGTAAMSAVVALCREMGLQRLSLTLHAENAVAQRLYRSTNFQPAGDRKFGEDVWTLAL